MSVTLRPSHLLRDLRVDYAQPAHFAKMSLVLRALAVVVVGCALATTAQAARVGLLSNTLAAQTAADYSAHVPGHTFTGVDVSASVPLLTTLLANHDVILLYE